MKINRFVIRHPHAIIGAVILVTAFFAYGVRRGLILDVSPLSFVENGSRSRDDFAEARKNFGPDDYMVIAVVCDDVFAPENLEKLRRLHEQIAREGQVAEILSLINIPFARSIEGGASLEKLLPESFNDLKRLAEARNVATTDRLFTGNLVSADSRTAALNILFKSDLPTHKRHELADKIYRMTKNSGFEESFFAGDPFSQWRGTEAIKSDLKLFLPLTLVLIALLLWLCFRSPAAVALPLLSIGIGLFWLMGLMAFLNAHFTILALMLPTLMLAIGCSYMIHVVNQIGIVYQKDENLEKGKILEEALEFITLPVIVSALTIIAGFLSLAFTGIPAIRATAIYSAIGAAFTMFLSLTFIPAALMILPKGAMAFRVGLAGKMVGLLEDTGRWATSRQTALYIFTAVIVIVSLIGMFRIKIDIDYFRFFKQSSETNVGLDEINRRLLGAVNFDIIVEGDRAGFVETTETLKRIEALQSFAEKLKDSQGQGIDRAVSVVDFVKHLNRAFNNGDPNFYDIPGDAKVIEELLAERDQLRGFISPDGRTARILVRSNLSASKAMAGAIKEIEKRGMELFPNNRVFATGTFVLLNRTSDQIAGEQIQSVSIALVTIFLMLSILFKSLRVGMTALIPNLIPVLFFFGFMGWRGIPLNLTTSLVASVVLGLAVDNSVQFIVRFRRIQREGADLREAIIQSMRLSGRPIIYANIALVAAFAVFALSNFEPIGSFGLLSAVTIIGCLVEDLVLLPARLTSPIFRAR